MKKFSRQRQVMLESLKSRTDHPTAEMLYQDIRKKMPEIGIATVYRNLAEFCEMGMVRKIKSELGPDRFDGNQNQHIHLCCKKCGRLEDVMVEEKELERFCQYLKEITRELGEIDSSVVLTGLCKKCIHKNTQNEKKK